MIDSYLSSLATFACVRALLAAIGLDNATMDRALSRAVVDEADK